MAIKFRKPAVKFIEKVNPDTLSRIREKLNQLATTVEEQGIIPFTELDIEQMKGEWEGFYRLRVGNVRIIFMVELSSGDIEVYVIEQRRKILMREIAEVRQEYAQGKVQFGSVADFMTELDK